jgi:hypothetical protein
MIVHRGAVGNKIHEAIKAVEGGMYGMAWELKRRLAFLKGKGIITLPDSLK